MRGPGRSGGRIVAGGRNGVVAFFAFCTWQPWPNASASALEDTDAMPTVDASDGKHHWSLWML